MTLSARVAYLKGLFDGMEYDKKDSRMMTGILELLKDMAQTVEELEEENAALNEVVDVLLENVFDSHSSASAQAEIRENVSDAEEVDLPAELEEREEVELEDQMLYQIVCPKCGEEIFVEEETLEKGSMQCPNCGEELEFDMAEEQEHIVELPNGLIGEIPKIES